jgi:hypothetical protein
MESNSLPCVLPTCGGNNLGFVALSGSNCSAGSKHQRRTTCGPRPKRHLQHTWDRAGFHDLRVPQGGMRNCSINKVPSIVGVLLRSQRALDREDA